MKPFRHLCVLSTLAGVALAASAQTDAITAKSIRIIVPLPAGSAPDSLARKIAANMATTLRRPVYVENKPGFSGFIGGQDVVRAPGDGGTLYVSVSSFIVITPQVYANIPYNPTKALQPLVQLGTTPLQLSVAADGKFKTLADYVAAAKAAPGQYSFASFGNGTAAHLMGEEFMRVAGIKLLHVPYKTSATPDVIGGAVDATITDVGSVKPFIGAPAKLRILAVAGSARSPEADVPTFGELGYKSMDGMVGWLGVFGPTSMSADTSRELADVIAKANQDPQVLSTMQTLGYQPTGVKGPRFAQIVRNDYQRWGQIIQSIGGIRLD